MNEELKIKLINNLIDKKCKLTYKYSKKLSLKLFLTIFILLLLLQVEILFIIIK